MKRNVSLDVLRCIAVVLVIGFHLNSPVYATWSRSGWIGVDLFFVLSGFLISGLLFSDYKAHSSIDWKRFVLRRGLKIWPPFYIFLGMTFWLCRAYDAPYTTRSFAQAGIFVLNYAMDSKSVLGGLLSHLWSLCVEEHFYILLPILLVALASLRRGTDPFRSIPWIAAALAVVALVLRWRGSYPHVIFETHYRLDSLFAGVALGYLYHFRAAVFAKLTSTWALVLGLALCVPAIFLQDQRILESLGVTLLALGFSLVLAWAVTRTPRGWPWIWLAALGARSYSIYLWHVYAVAMFTGRGLLAFWAGMGFALATGYLLSELIERPALAFRSYLDRKRTNYLDTRNRIGSDGVARKREAGNVRAL